VHILTQHIIHRANPITQILGECIFSKPSLTSGHIIVIEGGAVSSDKGFEEAVYTFYIFYLFVNVFLGCLISGH